jgi:hypothetical protein
MTAVARFVVSTAAWRACSAACFARSRKLIPFPHRLMVRR